MEEKSKTLICDKCQVEMEEREVEFSYLNRSFRHKVPRCPKCGQVFISEDLAKGRISQVEVMLEEK
ncbi:MAG: DVU_1557 family redox protein [Anaerovoracaceae bacterium]|jgi:NAD-dependent SIR2 family protein deacetylase